MRIIWGVVLLGLVGCASVGTTSDLISEYRIGEPANADEISKKFNEKTIVHEIFIGREPCRRCTLARDGEEFSVLVTKEGRILGIDGVIPCTEKDFLSQVESVKKRIFDVYRDKLTTFGGAKGEVEISIDADPQKGEICYTVEACRDDLSLMNNAGQ